MRFSGKTAIVTGAASGIGRAVAIRLAREGARVVLGDVNSAGLARVTAELGDTTLIRELDVRDPTRCAHSFSRPSTRLGNSTSFAT